MIRSLVPDAVLLLLLIAVLLTGGSGAAPGRPERPPPVRAHGREAAGQPASRPSRTRPAPAPRLSLDGGWRPGVVRRLGAGWVVLASRGETRGLFRASFGGPARKVACDPLPGAWGLWVWDADGDGRDEILVALRKRARFDPVLENRLHVYELAGHRCVPLWRGTRLAGRFDRLAPRGRSLLALERIGGGRRRVARYQWNGFGFSVSEVMWQGRTRPPGRILRLLDDSRR